MSLTAKETYEIGIKDGRDAYCDGHTAQQCIDYVWIHDVYSKKYENIYMVSFIEYCQAFKVWSEGVIAGYNKCLEKE